MWEALKALWNGGSCWIRTSDQLVKSQLPKCQKYPYFQWLTVLHAPIRKNRSKPTGRIPSGKKTPLGQIFSGGLVVMDKTALACFIVMAPSICDADKLIIGGLSSHPYQERQHGFIILPKYHGVEAGGLAFLEEVRYNETHPAIGLERHEYEATIFKNSFNEWSVSAARLFVSKMGFGIRIGAAKYGEDIRPVFGIGYFSENYDITMGFVTTIVLKIPLC